MYEIENYYLIDEEFLSGLEYKGIDITDDDMHHKNKFINRSINDYNICMNNLKSDIKKFRNICLKIEALKAKTTIQRLDPVIEENLYRSSIEEKDYKVLDNIEYTELKDMLFVPKLTINDFERTLLKDVEDNEEIDIDRDIEFDKDERSVLESLQQINKPVSPIKKLFK